MASEGGAGLLPIPCCSRELGSAAHLLAACLQTVAKCFSSSQSTWPGALGQSLPYLAPVDSPTPRSASLSPCPLRRHSSSVRAVCVNALARICAGGDQRWSSLPRQLSTWTYHVQPMDVRQSTRARGGSGQCEIRSSRRSRCQCFDSSRRTERILIRTPCEVSITRSAIPTHERVPVLRGVLVASTKRMRVDVRRHANRGVAEAFRNGCQVYSICQQNRAMAVPQRVEADALWQPSRLDLSLT